MSRVPPTQIWKTIRFFGDLARRYPRLLWPGVFMVPFTILAGEFLRPYIMAQILNRLSSGAYDHHNVWASFGNDILLYAGASLFYGIIGWRITVWLIWTLELNVTRDLTQRIFGHLMDMSASFHSNRFGGSLVSQANKLSGAYSRLVDSTVYALIPLVVALLATAAILTPRAPLFVAILMAFAVAYMAGTAFFSRQVRAANVAESAVQSRQTGYLADSLTNVMAIKTFAAGQVERDRFWDIGGEVREKGFRSMWATIRRENYSGMLNQGISITALIIAVVGVGVLQANIATVFLIVSYTASLADRLWSFQGVLRQYNRSFGDAADMMEILATPPEIEDPDKPEPSRIQHGAIVFDAVDFTHGDANEPLFENFNLDIKPGQKIGLVGASGSGKTTLTRLLLRFSDLDSGRITIDGQDITHITQDDLRRSISYVPQEPLLFHRTLRENISYGKPKATDEELLRAARRAHADEFIAKLPQGYDTLVGERGIKLSGGQRQRVAIARAMLKDAPILVLDEATSALDSESERLIQDALWKLMEGRTAIVIAHRLSTIQHMDRIVVLTDGAIVEQGSHAELIAHGGTYAKLWSRQSGGFIEE